MFDFELKQFENSQIVFFLARKKNKMAIDYESKYNNLSIIKITRKEKLKRLYVLRKKNTNGNQGICRLSFM